jgi:hypothetical protein
LPAGRGLHPDRHVYHVAPVHRDHMEADLHQEMAALRRKIAAFKFLPGSGNQVVAPGVDLSSV